MSPPTVLLVHPSDPFLLTSDPSNLFLVLQNSSLFAGLRLYVGSGGSRYQFPIAATRILFPVSNSLPHSMLRGYALCRSFDQVRGKPKLFVPFRYALSNICAFGIKEGGCSRALIGAHHYHVEGIGPIFVDMHFG